VRRATTTLNGTTINANKRTRKRPTTTNALLTGKQQQQRKRKRINNENQRGANNALQRMAQSTNETRQT
jgi:hypothetical protein